MKQLTNLMQEKGADQKADASECTTNMFTHKLPNRIDINVLSELSSIIDYDDLDYGDRSESLIEGAIADICSNPVGNAMFRRLIIELPIHKGELSPGLKIKIINLGVNDETKDKGSSYSHETYTVNVNLNRYNDDGTGIKGYTYYCLDDNSNITTKDKSLSGSLFHEFTHCLHHIEDRKMYDLYRKSKLPTISGDQENTKNSSRKGNPWTNKEERRTISGYIENEVYDPICDHMFDYFQSISRGISFSPRYSHLGHDSQKRKKDKCTNNEDVETKLQQYFQFDKKFMGF
jgi:hypothetical protein